MSLIKTTGNNGRLGNQIFRNLAFSIIAKKYNLKVEYYNHILINRLGIELFSGHIIYKDTINLTDKNYFYIYNCNNLKYNLNPNNNYFQSKDISNFLYNYLQKTEIKEKIIQKNPFQIRYKSNNDLYIHIRLTDAAKWNPGLNYYINTIKIINFDNIYISTDDKNHNIIKNLEILYPQLKLIDYEVISTIQFASTCKHIILSHGSFSAIIGYLSFFSNVYYPEYDSNKMWYGDMFSIQNWIKCVN